MSEWVSNMQRAIHKCPKCPSARVSRNITVGTLIIDRYLSLVVDGCLRSSLSRTSIPPSQAPPKSSFLPFNFAFLHPWPHAMHAPVLFQLVFHVIVITTRHTTPIPRERPKPPSTLQTYTTLPHTTVSIMTPRCCPPLRDARET